MFQLSTVFTIFSYLSGLLILTIFFSHLLAYLFAKKSPLKLNSNSFVVITGACMGIGYQMALEIATLYKCLILVIDQRKDLFGDVSKAITTAGGTCQCKCTDLSSKEQVNQLINSLLTRNKPINLFLYNAGIVIPKKSWQITPQQHHIVMNVNYFTPILMIQKLQPLLINNHIAVVASMMAIIHGGVEMGVYGASKRALFGYLASLRQEYKKFKKNITLSIACPYTINTTMFQGFRTKLDPFLRILDKNYVGKRLVKEFVQRKEVCYLYQYEAIIFKLVDFMPTQFIDYISINWNHSSFKNKEEKSATHHHTE